MAKSMSLLWGAGSPPCWRVMITMEEKRFQGYKRKLLSFEAGEHKSAEVLELNPRGQVRLRLKMDGPKVIGERERERDGILMREIDRS